MLTMLFEYGIVFIMSIILLLITGYLLYLLIRHPIKSLGFIFKAIVLLALGIIVWLGLFYWVTL